MSRSGWNKTVGAEEVVGDTPFCGRSHVMYRNRNRCREKKICVFQPISPVATAFHRKTMLESIFGSFSSPNPGLGMFIKDKRENCSAIFQVSAFSLPTL